MVSEILDFTQGGTPELVLPPIGYAGFIDELVKELRAEAALKSATVELENSPPQIELPLNPKRLRRLFRNLLHNSTDAMPEGGKVLLRFRSTPNAVVTE